MERSTCQTMDNNILSTIMVFLEAINRNMEKVQTDMTLMKRDIPSLKEEVSTMSGRLECVENQRSFLPSTPKNTFKTITPETLHQMFNPLRQLLNASQN